jgi:hypothetical protein
MDIAAAQVREGEGLTLETISFVETPDLAYEVDIQRGRMKLGDGDEMVPTALRVTSIFRREDDGWKVVHRHADPLTERRIEAVEDLPPGEEHVHQVVFIALSLAALLVSARSFFRAKAAS